MGAAASRVNDDDDDVFVYMGGEQKVPMDVRRVRIHRSVTTIPSLAFSRRTKLEHVEFHDGVEIVEDRAFEHCKFLNGVHMLGVREVGYHAFYWCRALVDLDIPAVEVIGECAFAWCPLRSLTLPCIRVLGVEAFIECKQLTDVYLGKTLEGIKRGLFGTDPFHDCTSLKRVTMPLKNDLEIGPSAFCRDVPTLKLESAVAVQIRAAFTSYRMYDLRDEMDADINRSYGISGRNSPIQLCIRTVLHRLKYWRAKHNMLLNGAMAEVDLALRTIQGSVIRLENKNERDEHPDVAVGYDRRDEAGVVIRNVLSFLML